MILHTIKKWFLKAPSNWQFWLLLGCFAKIALFLFKILQTHSTEIDNFWGYTGGDTPEYLSPIENLLKNGVYSPDYRMPGYGAVYLPFIFFFSKATACNLLIIFQVLLAGVSVYALALIAKHIFKSTTFFYATFYLYAISPSNNVFDTFLLTESLTVSLLIFSVYFLIRYNDNDKKITLLVSGLLITWVIFLRPVFMLVMGGFYLVILFHSIKNKRKLTITLLFLLPFTMVDSLWMVHNYKYHKTISPLLVQIQPPIQKDSPFYKNLYLYPAFHFVQSWGGSIIWWANSAEIRWFGIYFGRWSPKSEKENNAILPDNIYTSKFNKDSLEALKKMIIRINTDTTMPVALKHSYDQIVSEKFILYTQSIKQEKPMLYFIEAPFKLLKKFLALGGSGDIINEVSKKYYFAEYLLQLYSEMFYNMIIILGSIGTLLLSKNIFKLSVVGLIPFISLYIIIIHPIILRFTEGRYLVPALPFMLICSIYTIHWCLRKFNIGHTNIQNYKK